jgi:hypothetical protein
VRLHILFQWKLEMFVNIHIGNTIIVTQIYKWLVESYSYTIANAAIWLATLLDIYSSIDSE